MGVFSEQEQTYRLLEPNEEGKPALFFELEKDRNARRKKGWKNWKTGVCLGLSTITNFALAAMLVTLVCKPQLLPRSQTVDEKFTYRSASFDKVVQEVNGTLFPTDSPSWSRLPQNSTVDNYWSWFDPPRFMPLSEADVISMGKDPKTVVKFPDSWNMPAGSYMGAVDLFHKFHCLGELRRKAFDDFPSDMPKPHTELDALHWIHLGHCADMLAQDLQCNAKLDVMTFDWMDTQPNIYPDFSIQRICTNWDQFLDWNEKNTVDSRDYPLLVRPEGVTPIRYQDMYYESYGFGGSVLFPGGEGYEHRGY